MSFLPKKAVALSIGLVMTAVAATGAMVVAPTSAGAASSGLSSSECAANKAVGTINYVSPFGFDASGGIIDVFAAQQLGYFKKMCLTVAINAAAQNGNELVSAGRAQVTNTGSAADQLSNNANGANIVGVATLANISDTAVLTLPNIGSLTGLEGQTLAYHTALPVSLQAMMTKAGVDMSKVHLVSSNDYDPNQLFEGNMEGLQAYQSNEPLALRAEGKSFHEFTPAEYGVKGTYNVQGFNGTFLKNHRQAATDWIRADLHAVNYCISHQTECVNIEHNVAVSDHAATAFPLDHEKEVWKFESNLIAKNTLPGKGIGVQTYAEWTPETKQLVQYNVVKSPPSLKSWEDVKLAASLYSGKTLSWP